MGEKIITGKLSLKILLEIAIIFGIIEGIALLFIAILSIDNKTSLNLFEKFFGGIIVGIITIIGALPIINLVLSKSLIHPKITRISYTTLAILDGILLAILFTVESIISPIKQINIIFGNSIAGATVILISLPITIEIYNYFSKFKYFKIYTTRDKKNYIKKITIFKLTIITAIYEAMALPIMAYLEKGQFLYSILGDKIGFALIGFIAGFLASTITLLIYKILFKKIEILELS